jgi:hypothetical protein
MNHKRIFTAVLLITLGVIGLLQFFEIVHFSWWAVFRLWPIILIWIGIKFIPITDTWKLILKILVLLLGVLLLFYYSNSRCCSFSNWCYNYKSDGEKKVVVKTIIDDGSDIEIYGSTENDDEGISCNLAKLNLSASAGKLTIAPGKALFDMEKNDNSQYINTKIKKTLNGKKANITVDISPVKNFSYSNNTLKYDVLLSVVPVWELDLDLNATANDIDLSDFKVKTLQLEANASAIDLKLGNLYEEVEVNVEANAGSVKISLPKDMRCIINKDNTLSSMKIKGFKKQKDGSYLSEDGIETVGTVRISVEANVSSVEIGRY